MGASKRLYAKYGVTGKKMTKEEKAHLEFLKSLVPTGEEAPFRLESTPKPRTKGKKA